MLRMVIDNEVISIAHKLSSFGPGHKCAGLHGHDIRIVCELRTQRDEPFPDHGMIKAIWRAWDHKFLNQLPDFTYKELDPTAENSVMVLARLIMLNIPRYVELHSLRWYETPNVYVEYLP